mmetsp:Transcript_99992/g.180407  ORF Transcript_99992/g.180407 Transcript_99992/m.180407 type:complete len:220 (-) Transcript_99992:421-1080(-)
MIQAEVPDLASSPHIQEEGGAPCYLTHIVLGLRLLCEQRGDVRCQETDVIGRPWKFQSIHVVKHLLPVEAVQQVVCQVHLASNMIWHASQDSQLCVSLRVVSSLHQRDTWGVVAVKTRMVGQLEEGYFPCQTRDIARFGFCPLHSVHQLATGPLVPGCREGDALQAIDNGRLADVWKPNDHEHEPQSARMLGPYVVQGKLLDLDEVLVLRRVSQQTRLA